MLKFLRDIQYVFRSIFKGGKNTPVNDGYNHKEIEPGDYQYGAVAKTVKREDGQWTDFLPTEERQSGKGEMMCCTSMGTNGAIETIFKAVHGLVINLSDRALAIASGTTKKGNNINNVIDTVRKTFGAIAESLFPWNPDTFTWEMFYTSIPKNLYIIAKNWMTNVEIFREDVPLNPTMMMDALKYSPLIVAGYAWYLENGLYRSYGSANHCFFIVGYVKGQYWLAFDSYSPFLKKLAWDFRFGACKLLTINVKEPIKDYSLGVTDGQAERNNLLARGLKYVQRAEKGGAFYRLTSDCLIEIPTQEEIAQDIADTILDVPEGQDKQAMVNSVIRAMTASKILVGITEEEYQKISL